MLPSDLQPRDSAQKCPGFSSFCLKSRLKVDFSGIMLMHVVFIVVAALSKYLKCKMTHFMLSVALQPPGFDLEMAISRIFRHSSRLKDQF